MTVLATLALLDPDQQTLAVDIADLQRDHFGRAQPSPVGNTQRRLVLEAGASLLERLGIAGEMKPKTRLSPSGKVLYASVANGDVQIGFNQISEVLAQPSIEFAGPLPSAIQNYTVFAPGIVTDSNQADAAGALVTYLTSPAAKAVFKAKGFE